MRNASNFNFDPNRVNLVNEQDEILDTADKYEAHLGKALLHQAVSLFLFRENNDGTFDLLLQQRSPEKIVGAQQWANTLCGNVAQGELHRDCVTRRLKEELGLVLSTKLEKRLKEFFTFTYSVACNDKYSEREVDHFFVLIVSPEEANSLMLKLNPHEVRESAWKNWSELTNKNTDNNLVFAPWFKLFIENEATQKAINQQLTESKHG